MVIVHLRHADGRGTNRKHSFPIGTTIDQIRLFWGLAPDSGILIQGNVRDGKSVAMIEDENIECIFRMSPTTSFCESAIVRVFPGDAQFNFAVGTSVEDIRLGLGVSYKAGVLFKGAEIVNYISDAASEYSFQIDPDLLAPSLRPTVLSMQRSVKPPVQSSVTAVKHKPSKFAVERQSKLKGGIWDSIVTGDVEKAKMILNDNEDSMFVRGPVGELPIHLAFLFFGDAQVAIAKDMLQREKKNVDIKRKIPAFYSLVDSPYTTAHKCHLSKFRKRLGEEGIRSCFCGDENTKTKTHQHTQLDLMENVSALGSFDEELSDYEGETILHIAIVKQDLEMVRFLIEYCHADWDKHRAYGSFFRQDGTLYYGEWVLHFAACVGNKAIVEYLLSLGANPLKPDSYGNSVFHMMVHHGDMDMYDYVLETWLRRKTDDERNIDEKKVISMVNGDALTPLTMAAQLGHKHVFKHLLEKHKITAWTYGPVTCKQYPLHDIDTYSATEAESHRGKSALELIILNEHLDLITLPFIRQLLSDKWERFAKKRFIIQWLVYMMFLLVLSLAVFYRDVVDDGFAQGFLVVGWICELIAVFAALSTTTYELYTLYSNQHHQEEVAKSQAKTQLEKFLYRFRSPNTPVTSTRSHCPSTHSDKYASFIPLPVDRSIKPAPPDGHYFYHSPKYSSRDTWKFDLPRVIFLCVLSSLLVSSCLLRYFQSRVEDIVLTIAVISGWIASMYFARGFALTGPFIVMIEKMVMGDIARFVLIFSVFLVGFSEAFYIVFARADNPQWQAGQSFLTLFLLLLGAPPNTDSMPPLSYILFVLYSLVAYMVMINLLAAMLANTFNSVSAKAEHQWLLQRAKIIMSIEHRLSINQRKKYALGVEIQQDTRYYQMESFAQPEEQRWMHDSLKGINQIRHNLRCLTDRISTLESGFVKITTNFYETLTDQQHHEDSDYEYHNNNNNNYNNRTKMDLNNIMYPNYDPQHIQPPGLYGSPPTLNGSPPQYILADDPDGQGTPLRRKPKVRRKRTVGVSLPPIQQIKQ